MPRTFLVIGLLTALAGIGAFSHILSRIGEIPAVGEPPTWPLVTTSPIPPSAPTRPGRPSMRGLGWQVVDYLSAHGVLVVTVGTHRIDEATDIAVELVDPLKDGYAEVLVYFRRPHEALAARRVQWTPSSGFIETDFSELTGVPHDGTSHADSPDSPRSKGS